MIIIKIDLDCADKFYTQLCNQAEKDKVFKACGNVDEKWIMLRFSTEKQKEDWIKNNFKIN